MKKFLAVAALVAGLMMLTLGVASAKPITPADGELSQSAVPSAECGRIDVTFTNTTRFLFVLGVRVVGGDEVGELPIDGRESEAPDTVTVTLPPDGPVTETTTVTYGTVEGAEQDWYLPWQTIVVEPCPAAEEPPATEQPPAVGAAGPSEEEVVYENCAAVRAAGKAPILEGQPGYRPALDRDGDGVGCEVPGAVQPAANGDNDSEDGEEAAALADTGVDGITPWLAGGGVLLLAGGGGLLVLARRRSVRSAE